MNKIKYPRTYHFHFSEGMGNDDKKIKNYNDFVGKEVIATVKMDGENSTGYSDNYTHARSIDSQHHSSRDWFKKFWAERAYKLPEGWRVCGENLYAQHSIWYPLLPSYFMGFSIWNDKNVALSWDDTLMWFEELGIEPVPTEWVSNDQTYSYRGKFDLEAIKHLTTKLDTSRIEGLVVRVTDEIPYEKFDTHFVKWVRKGHVTTDEHWMSQAVIPNQLRS
jgi:hypothetical protein